MSSAVEPVASNGLVLDRYRPLRPLGSGGSGRCGWCATRSPAEQFALKIIAREGRAAPRAEREAEAATRLRHPHCLRAYGLEMDAEHLYIPYEYVPGETLRQACARISSATKARSRRLPRCSRGWRSRTRAGSCIAT